MAWIKSPQENIDTFTKAASVIPVAEQKKMFGYPSIFVNGYLTAGLFQDKIMFRLSGADREAFLKIEGAGDFAPMPGRPMKDYLAGPGSILKDGKLLAKWLGKAVNAATALPPKKIGAKAKAAGMKKKTVKR